MPRPIPVEPGFDNSLALLREGYRFIPNRCRRFQSDIFQTRLLGQNTICLSGETAARLFYDEALFRRAGAAPRPLKRTLLGDGGVQTLDGGRHRLRKEMFMSLMTPEAIGALAEGFTDIWRARLETWQQREAVVLFDEVNEILCRAVCDWAGVPLLESEVRQRTDQLTALIEGAGGVGLRHLRARQARGSTEHWMVVLIEQVRGRQLVVPEQRALAVIAAFRDTDGRLLDERTAAVEVLNVLRPTVAVGRFIVLMARALHRHPHYRDQLRHDDSLIGPFVQEVRRLYAFFPFNAAITRRDIDWQGYRLPAGTRVLLDFYGTNRDSRVWEEPELFRPERFRHWDGSSFNFLTQGGGNHYRNHRCPGEWITIALMKAALRLLTREMDYAVPAQDLSVSTSYMPLIPASRFVMREVRPVTVPVSLQRGTVGMA